MKSKKRAMKSLFRKWKQYKYRFVPWLIVNLKNRSMRSVSHSDTNVVPSEKLQVDLFMFLSGLHNYYENNKMMMNSSTNICKQQAGLEYMREFFGFSVQRTQSILSGVGQGIQVTSGTIPSGSLTSLYPGLIYEPYEPIFFQSIGNPFIFRCVDGMLIDGNDKGLSRSLYKSCRGRDSMWPLPSCDDSWLGHSHVCPLNVGQYVNNHNKQYPANVAYQELDVGPDFPAHLRQYLPNTFYSSVIHSSYGDTRCLRLIALVSLREIQCGEELFSSYFTLVR